MTWQSWPESLLLLGDQVYADETSEATRELRDTSRRRRDAEEKLQQHLREAKEHVPHHHPGEVPLEVPKADKDPEPDEDD